MILFPFFFVVHFVSFLIIIIIILFSSLCNTPTQYSRTAEHTHHNNFILFFSIHPWWHYRMGWVCYVFLLTFFCMRSVCCVYFRRIFTAISFCFSSCDCRESDIYTCAGMWGWADQQKRVMSKHNMKLVFRNWVKWCLGIFLVHLEFRFRL